MNEHTKFAIDGVAGAATVAALIQWLPPIAAILSIIWTLIRIAETDTAKRVYTWVKGKLS
jgi:hypothetical protein